MPLAMPIPIACSAQRIRKNTCAASTGISGRHRSETLRNPEAPTSAPQTIGNSMLENSPESDGLELNRISERIARLISDHRALGHSRYFLSQLGSALGEDKRKLESITGKKLMNFLTERFDYNIESSGIHNNVYSIIFSSNGSEVLELNAPPPRFNPKFWAAFAVPLPPADTNRFIDLVSLRFGSSREQVERAGSDIREIGRELINNKEIGMDSLGTAQNILTWLKEQSLSVDQFLARRTRPPSSSTLLEDLFLAIGTDDLKRISLPLDIVQKLNTRRL